MLKDRRSSSLRCSRSPPEEEWLCDSLRSDLFLATLPVKLTYEAPHSPEAWQRLQTALPHARNQKWFSRTIGGLPKDSWVWEQRRLNAGYDPAHTFRRVKCPVLIIYGEKDNPSQGIARIELALKEAGNRDYVVRVFPGADHDLDVGQPNDGKVVWAEGFLDLLTKWTLQRVTVASETSR